MNNLAPNESVIGDPVKDSAIGIKQKAHYNPYSKTITVL